MNYLIGIAITIVVSIILGVFIIPKNCGLYVEKK